MSFSDDWVGYLLVAPLVLGFALVMFLPLYLLVRWTVDLFGSPQEDSIWRPLLSLLLWAVQAYYWFQLLSLGRNGGHPFGITPEIFEAVGSSLCFWIIAGILAASAPDAVEDDKATVEKSADVSLR
jgi:hypothetical protein